MTWGVHVRVRDGEATVELSGKVKDGNYQVTGWDSDTSVVVASQAMVLKEQVETNG